MAQRLALTRATARLGSGLRRTISPAVTARSPLGFRGNSERKQLRCRPISSTPTLRAGLEPRPPAEDLSAEDGDIPLRERDPETLSTHEKESLQAELDCPDGEEVPMWQNPRHHNDPEKKKVFFEDFGPDDPPPKIAPLPPFDPVDGGVPVTPELAELADDVLKMNLMEVRELTKRIAEHFGMDDDVIGGGLSGGGGGGGGSGGAGEEEAAAEEEERTHFDLKLISFDPKAKIKVIKEVRAVANLGLKEAKVMVEGAPKIILKEIKKDEIDAIKEKLEAIGAVIEVV